MSGREGFGRGEWEGNVFKAGRHDVHCCVGQRRQLEWFVGQNALRSVFASRVRSQSKIETGSGELVSRRSERDTGNSGRQGEIG